jgi:uncharacterized membrane protein
MSRPRSIVVALLAVALALLAAAPSGVAAARGSAPGSRADASLLNVYENTGAIPPCRFTIKQLSQALRNIDTFDSVYFVDFPAAIRAALSQRSGGACGTSGRSSSVSVAAPAANGPSAGLPSGSVTAGTSAPVPLPLVLLAILALGFGAVAGSVAMVRAQGWDPAWAATLRHTFGEAGYRLGGAWEELADRRRPGRRRAGPTRGPSEPGEPREPSERGERGERGEMSSSA